MPRGWVAGLGLCVLLLAAGAQTAAAQYFGQNKVQYRQYDWRSISSDHFEVYFYSGLDSLAMRVLDLAEKAHVMLSERIGHSLAHRVPIILYGSHNDFSQTNVTPELVDAGTGGFTEVLRNRVVIPFTGSYEDLRHVVVHELTHAIMFDELYGGSAASLIARQSFFSMPLWFAEGSAEYFSLGMESNAEMFLRDGTLEGYLPPLEVSGGYIVYKQGQSAISYLVDRFGEERYREIVQRIRTYRSFERAFQRSTGMSVQKFDEQWRDWLKRQYWPTVAVKEDPDRFARQLTDHRKDESNLNTAPAVSPDGGRIAYFTDRRQYTDVYVMSAIDGRRQHRVIRGERNVQFENIPSFRSSITWSPDGTRLALTAKSAGRDVLYILDVAHGHVLKRFDIGCESLYYPAWSPGSDSIAVAGVHNGRSDLYLVDAKTGHVRRLTNDTWDEKEPAWTPDGTHLTFASDRVAPVVLQAVHHEGGAGSYALYDLDLKTGEVTQLIETYGIDHSPAWSGDGRRLAFISDRNGTPNIYVWDRTDSSVTQLTDVAGGVSSLSWSAQGDRLVFSAFNRGGFDVYAVREPLSAEGVLHRLQRHAPQTVLTMAEARVAPTDTLIRLAPMRGALAAVWADSLSPVRDSLGSHRRERRGPDDHEPGRSGPALVSGAEPPAWVGDRPRPEAAPPVRDSAAAIVATIPLVERGGPFELPDSVLGQPSTPYHVHLSPDYAGGGFYAATGYGFIGSTQFNFSDFLGNHNLYIATDIFSSSLDETNALAIYNYLPRRWDYGVGLFHFKNYYSSQVSTLGESFGSPRLFSERNFGFLGEASYPFDRFRRVDFNFTQMFVERQFFLEDVFGNVYQANREYRSVSSPSVSLVGDNSLFGYYGPVNGGRYNLTYAPSLAVFPNALEYNTFTLDARRYWDLGRGYNFAARLLGGVSEGRDPQTFFVGGYATLRGYPDFSLLGTRMAIVNTELRFPFIQQLGLVGPVPIGWFNLRGAVFGDVGAVWNGDTNPRLSREGPDGRVLMSPRVGFGVGLRSAVYFFILKLDTAWHTDLQHVSKPRWHFSIGPEF
jgi:Tol biopolymer transport system component